MENTMSELFVKNALTDQNFFEIKGEDVIFHCFVRPVGRAKYVYGIRLYRPTVHEIVNICETPSLIAIVSDNVVYLVNEFGLFDRWSSPLPPQTKRFSDYAKEIIVQFTNRVRDIRASMPAQEITDENILWHCKEEARRIIFCDADLQDRELLGGDYVTKDMVSAILAGYESLELAVKRLVEEKKEHLQQNINFIACVQEFIDSKEGISPHDIELGEALNGPLFADAQNISVTFERGGAVTKAKMEKKNLLRILANNDSISNYHFPTNPIADKVYQNLGLTSWDHLYTSDIRSLKFRNREFNFAKEL